MENIYKTSNAEIILIVDVFKNTVSNSMFDPNIINSANEDDRRQKMFEKFKLEYEERMQGYLDSTLSKSLNNNEKVVERPKLEPDYQYNIDYYKAEYIFNKLYYTYLASRDIDFSLIPSELDIKECIESFDEELQIQLDDQYEHYLKQQLEDKSEYKK